MNDSLPPLDDDQLSAHLDGVGDPSVEARLDSDPVSRARLDQLRTARDALGRSEPDPLPDEQVDLLIRHALSPGPDAVPKPRRSTPPIGVVAAVVLVLMGVGMVLVWSGTRADRRTDPSAVVADAPTDAAAESSADRAGASGSGGESGAAADAAPPNAPPTTLAPGAAASTVTALGAFATPEELRSSLADGFPPTATTTTGSSKDQTDGPGIERCAQSLSAVMPVSGAPSRVGLATIGGDPVLVYDFPLAPDPSTTTAAEAPASTLTVAVTPKACAYVFGFQR